MEYRNLEITLHRADLYVQRFNAFATIMDVYAAVSISGVAPPARDRRRKLELDSPATFTVGEEALQENRLTLDLQFVYEWPIGDGEEAYEMHLPIKQLFDSSFNKSTKFEFKPSANRKGKLKFSYWFGERLVGVAPAPPYAAAVLVGMEQPAMGYPVGPPASASASFPPSAPAVEEGDGSALPPPQTVNGNPTPPPEDSNYALGFEAGLLVGMQLMSEYWSNNGGLRRF